VGGIPEVVREGQTGLLVPPGDVQALAAAVASLLGDPARAHRMGRQAWHLAREQFSSDRILDMWADIWRRAARRSSEGSQGVETT
jgi:glycosyltransferase involved in cell wall biosynthesis